MKWFDRIRNMKFAMVLAAMIIAVGSLLTSNYLIEDLKKEEMNRMEVWAEAMRSLNNADETTDLNLVLKVINGNNSIPVIVLGSDGDIYTTRNIDGTYSSAEDSILIVKEMADAMKAEGHVIRIYIDVQGYDEVDREFMEICYDDSTILKRLEYYPFVQLAVVVIFFLVAIFALFSSMKSEQNKVWVGLSKETAHQLGTPISALMAWNEVLKDTYPDDVLLPEMEKDIKRLERIAERFSKIGSIPEPKPEDVCEVLGRVVTYMDKRTSSKVKITTHFSNGPVIINLIASLFEWVAENLCKNAVDAMDGAGSIDIYLEESDNWITFRFKDTGKGIQKSNFSSVFKPGFTTKARGWGLGLSLAKRIVEEYHKGKIYVESSEVGKGTTFRIDLPK